MIITKPKTNIVTQGIQGAVSFGIKQEGLAHIFNVLRNQLYSNKILAVIREYSCNAVDAHTEAGIPDCPIQVTMPNRLNPKLKIRDYGSGLTTKEVQEVYAFYGESTKRQSNSLIGQLGLGSKSAFSYGDSFLINSYTDGTHTTYNAYIDESQIGQIATIASQPTKEKNGIEIVVTIKPSDCETFISTAKGLFKYFKVKPVIKGTSDFYVEEEVKKIETSGKDWTAFKSDRYTDKSIVIMGNIGYTLESDSLKLDENNNQDSKIESLIKLCRLELIVDIGDLDIAASREGLQYTDKTISSIKKKLSAIIHEMGEATRKELDEAKSLWSFKKIASEVMNVNYGSRQLKGIPFRHQKTFNFKSQKVINCTHQGFDGFVKYNPRKGYVTNSQGLSSYMVKGAIKGAVGKSESVWASKDLIIVDNTKGLKHGIINYIFPLLEQDQSVLVYDFGTGSKKQLLLKKLGMIESDIVDMATLTKVKLPTSRGASTGSSQKTKSSKHSSKVFTFNHTFSGSSYHVKKSDYWNIDSIDFDSVDKNKFCYIVIDRFVPVTSMTTGRLNDPYEITQLLTSFRELIKQTQAKGITIPKIIGVKASLLSKASSSKLLDLRSFFQKEMVKIEKQCNFSKHLYGSEIVEKFGQEAEILSQVSKELGEFPSVQNTNTGLTLKIINNLITKQDLIRAAYRIEKAFGFTGKEVRTQRSNVLDRISTHALDLSQKMRLLRWVETHSINPYRHDFKKAREAVCDYILTRDSRVFKLNLE